MSGRPELPADLRGINVRDFLEQTAARDPQRAFIRTRSGDISYAAFDRDASRAAAAWQELGVGRGDRVVFMADNGPEFLVAWLGLAKIGAILVAVNTRFQASETQYLIEHAEPKLALASPAHADVLAAAATAAGRSEALLGLGATVGDGDFLARLGRQQDRYDREPIAADDVISFIYTSGTTGRPKAVMQTHGNYVLTGQAYPTWLRLQPGATLYCCLPLFHINAQAYSSMGTIGLGGTLGLVERFSATQFWGDVVSMGANAFNYIGAIVAILMQRVPEPAEREHAIQVAYGAPSFPEDQRRAIEDRFGFAVMSGFGMSETTFGLTEQPVRDRPSASIGRPRLHPDPRITNEVRIVDDAGRDVPVGQVGELIIRNPVTMKGYFRDPERTAEALRDGWLYTGDYVRCDEQGFYYYVDRKKDIVRRRGENVSSVEVEVTLLDHPAVEEAAVIGVPAELSDEEIVAIVVPRAGATPDPPDLAQWCADRLADFKVPRYVLIVDELPKTPTQKVEKVKLRASVGTDRTDWWDREAAR